MCRVHIWHQLVRCVWTQRQCRDPDSLTGALLLTHMNTYTHGGQQKDGFNVLLCLLIELMVFL